MTTKGESTSLEVCAGSDSSISRIPPADALHDKKAVAILDRSLCFGAQAHQLQLETGYALLSHGCGARTGNFPGFTSWIAAQGRFELMRLKRAQFALRRGDTILGISAMPIPSGFSRMKIRIELPASLPLTTQLFLAMLVKIEDTEGFSSTK